MERISVSIDQLEFDPQNPRLPITRRNRSVEETIGYFISKENIFELISSIGEQGWVDLEPMLVVPNGDKYTVVEGNRRLASLLLLKNPSLAPIKRLNVQELVDQAVHKPTEIEVLKYEDRSQVLNYLGYRHITGVDEWDSLAKARYLQELAVYNQSVSGLTGSELFSQLARIIGSRPDYVQKLLKGYFLYEKIRDENYYETGLDDEKFSFSLLTTAVSYKNITDYVEVKSTEDETSWTFNQDHLKDLIEWMFKETVDGEKRVPESRALKTLNAVVGNERALKVFRDENKSLDYARRFTDEPIDFFNKAVDDAHKLVDAAISQLQFFEHAPKYTGTAVQRLQRKVTDLNITIQGRIKTEDDNQGAG